MGAAVILFQRDNAPKVLDGTKTHTRRIDNGGPCRWKVGSLRKCYTKPPFTKGGADPFAIVRILDVHREKLNDISLCDARLEGYASLQGFFQGWDSIHWSVQNIGVWVIAFELVEACP